MWLLYGCIFAIILAHSKKTEKMQKMQFTSFWAQYDFSTHFPTEYNEWLFPILQDIFSCFLLHSNKIHFLYTSQTIKLPRIMLLLSTQEKLSPSLKLLQRSVTKL